MEVLRELVAKARRTDVQTTASILQQGKQILDHCDDTLGIADIEALLDPLPEIWQGLLPKLQDMVREMQQGTGEAAVQQFTMESAKLLLAGSKCEPTDTSRCGLPLNEFGQGRPKPDLVIGRKGDLAPAAIQKLSVNKDKLSDSKSLQEVAYQLQSRAEQLQTYQPNRPKWMFGAVGKRHFDLWSFEHQVHAQANACCLPHSCYRQDSHSPMSIHRGMPGVLDWR